MKKLIFRKKIVKCFGILLGYSEKKTQLTYVKKNSYDLFDCKRTVSREHGSRTTKKFVEASPPQDPILFPFYF